MSQNTTKPKPTKNYLGGNNMTDEKELTYGEKLVQVDFNPSGASGVGRIKAKAAELIDEINATRANDDTNVARWKAIAINHIETGCMFGVKATVLQKTFKAPPDEEEGVAEDPAENQDCAESPPPTRYLPSNHNEDIHDFLGNVHSQMRIQGYNTTDKDSLPALGCLLYTSPSPRDS